MIEASFERGKSRSAAVGGAAEEAETERGAAPVSGGAAGADAAFPRTRGDDPLPSVFRNASALFSPHPRG